eukprot:1173390-Prorocentrum_minimum.AAC.1
MRSFSCVCAARQLLACALVLLGVLLRVIDGHNVDPRADARPWWHPRSAARRSSKDPADSPTAAPNRFAQYAKLSNSQGDADPGRGIHWADTIEDDTGTNLPADFDQLLPEKLDPHDIIPRAFALEHTKTLSLKEMRLCEVVNGGSPTIKERQFTCKEDPSCLQCIDPGVLGLANLLLEVHQ